MPSSPRCSSGSAECIVVDLHFGQLRKLHALMLLAAGVAGGWLWFGNAGAALLGLWAFALQRQAWRGGRHRVCLPLAELRSARLAEHRVFCRGRRGRCWAVFADELSTEEYARLRRRLKRWFGQAHAPDSAGHRL